MPSSPDGDRESLGGALEERVQALAAWVDEIDARVRAAELLTGDEKTAKELRRAIEAATKHDPKLESRLTNRVDVLADRLATLASTVSVTSAALARKDGDVAALRRELDEKGTKLVALGAELGRRVSTDGDLEKIRATLATLSTQRPEPSNDRLDRFGGKVEWLSERVDTLATTVATTAAGLAGREGELAALRQRLDDDAAQIAKALSGLRDQHRGDLGGRIDLLEHGVATTASELAGKDAELAALRGRIDEAYEKIGAVIADIQRAVVGLSAQVAALEELPRVSPEATARYDELEASVEITAGALSAFASRLEAIERAESSRRDLLEDLSARLSEVKDSVGERFDTAQRDRQAVETDLGRVLDTWASDRSSLEARFEEIERRLARTEELDDLARRLDAVEHGPHGVFSPADGPLAGDGRFRLELRALELRLEQAENTALESRDAVLAQLERIASRIEPREEAPHEDHPAPASAEVVPFRGAEV